MSNLTLLLGLCSLSTSALSADKGSGRAVEPGCKSAPNIDQNFRTRCSSNQGILVPAGVQLASRFTTKTYEFYWPTEEPYFDHPAL
jgi:hypothetical protein